MRRLLILVIVLACSICSNQAQAEFDVNWGNSWDAGDGPGYDFIATWLVANSYFSNLNDARIFAQNDYIGADPSDFDPFHFKPGKYQLEIHLEIAGYKDLNILGYYTNGGSKTLVEVFSGPEGAGTDPKTIMVGQEFGLYMHSAYNGGTDWFTDRAQNQSAQGGTPFNSGGDAQALLYELAFGRKWLVAWEDLDATKLCGNHTDNDYNDMFATIALIPEPSSILLLGSGLLGLAGARMRRKRIT